MKTLTKSQIKTLEVIFSLEKQLGRFPRLRELATELGLKSHLSAYDRINSLRQSGALIYRKEDYGKPSPFELSDEARKFVNWVGPDIDFTKSGSYKVISPNVNLNFPQQSFLDSNSTHNESKIKMSLINGIPNLFINSNSTIVIVTSVIVLSTFSLVGYLVTYSGRSIFEINSVLIIIGFFEFQILKFSVLNERNY